MMQQPPQQQQQPPLQIQQQQQQQYHHKGTPGRRRQNQHSTHSPANRTYASENDMADVPFPMDFSNGHGTPQTPRKSPSNSPAPNFQAGTQKSKSRTGNKPRPKHVSTSPGPAKNGRSTPPHSAVPKTGTSAAFAGATFHASPAPSSLPIPSFLAKALDSPGLKSADRVSQEPSPPATDSEAPTPLRHPASLNVAREDSPLDLFFRADRAEKERARRASSANALAGLSFPPGPFSPPSQPRSPRELRAVPNGAATDPAHRHSHLRNLSNGVASSERNMTPGKSIGPAFSTPYQERIRAARTNEKSAPPGPSAQAAPTSQADRSDALKKFLAIGSPSLSTGPSASGSQTRSAFPPVHQVAGPTVSQVQHISVTSATTVVRPSNERSPDLLHMENSLRQILRLDNLGAASTSTNYRSS